MVRMSLKFLRSFNLLGTVTIATATLLFVGCANPHSTVVRKRKSPVHTMQPVTLEEVIDMSSHGIPSAEAIRQLKKCRPIRNLTLEDVLLLREAGVHDKVINYLIRPDSMFKSGR